MDNCICITHTAKYRCRFYDNGTGGCDKPNENMQPRTRTTLGELRTGDRFHFASKSNEVWEVVEQHKNNSSINKFDPVTRAQVFRFHTLKSNSQAVVFLRHTQDSINETDELKGRV